MYHITFEYANGNSPVVREFKTFNRAKYAFERVRTLRAEWRDYINAAEVICTFADVTNQEIIDVCHFPRSIKSIY